MNSPHHIESAAAIGLAGIATANCIATHFGIKELLIASWEPLSFVVSCSAYLFGSILPDVDTKSSWLGRFVHVRVTHRTWTHALYIPILLIILSRKKYWLLPMALGYLVHLWCDSISAAGICWLYPYPGYIHYSSGAFVKKGHKLKLYRTGNKSESRAVAVIILLSLLLTTAMLYLTYAPTEWLALG